jgi:hypothetical protein
MRALWAIAAVLLAVLLVGVTGCFTVTSECLTDQDCAGGDVCANTHACLAPSQVQHVAVHWTIGGSPADADRCAPTPELQLSIIDSESDTRADYAPVPCATGQFTFDKLPTSYDRVALAVLGSAPAQEAAVPTGGGDVRFDLGSESFAVAAARVAAVPRAP